MLPWFRKEIIKLRQFIVSLVSKPIEYDLKFVLDQVEQIVNYMKERPLKSLIFSKLYEIIGGAHVSFIWHTEVRWLSRGQLLHFFIEEYLVKLSDLLTDELWPSKREYLVDIFIHLKKVNIIIQGRNETVVNSTDNVFNLAQNNELQNAHF